MKIQTTHLLHPNYRPDIDGLRAVAVLSVVVFHAFPDWIKGGFIGVDIFFVISGFLISSIIFENLEKGTFSFYEFYARRIKRIFPALLLVLIASFSFGWFALLADEYKQLGKHISAGASFISNFILWGESGYFDNSADTKPLLHLWSLGIEEQFYIIWPFILWFAWKRNFNLLTLTIIITLISYSFNLKGIKQDTVSTFYSPQTRFWELLSGSILAWLTLNKKNSFDKHKLCIDSWIYKIIYKQHHKINEKTLSNIVSFIGCLILTYGFWQITKNTSFPGKWAVIPVFGTVLIIIAGPHAWFNRKILSNKLMVAIGLISFPLYLWHWPLLSFARILEIELPNTSVRILAVALSVLLAWLTYKFVEYPIRSSKIKKFTTATLLVIMAIVGAAGYHLYINEGYEFRDSIKGFVNNKNELIRTPAIDDSCLSYIDLKAPLFSYCRFTNVNSNETIAIVGDSHAHVAYPGIAEFLEARGKNTVLIANSSCPPFLGSPTGNSQTEVDACIKKVQQILEVLEKKKDIKKVFIFTRGPIYITNTEPLTGNKKGEGKEIPLQQFINSAQASFKRLTSKGKAIFYVSENPELNFHPNSCLSRPLRTSSKTCFIHKESVLERQSEYRKAFSHLENITFIDTLNTFCPDDKCRIFDDNGALLYADDDHISVAGSRFQVKNLLVTYLD